MARTGSAGHSGFALVELLAALAITALLVALFLPIVSTSLSRWSLTIARGERLDEVTRARVSLGLELESLARLPATPERRAEEPQGEGQADAPLWFRGDATSVIFPRLFTEPGKSPSLMAVALTIEDADGRLNLLRRFAAFDRVRPTVDPRSLGHPHAVLTQAVSMRFIFVDRNGERRARWEARPDLPSIIELWISFGEGKDDKRLLSLTLPAGPEVQ
ncbi:hypothetical protein BJF93_12810 [Xaviernesmea oryzae]|uniref:General secretion pathway protein J n=1 Tax=Xaviernesmea oryzae TaxID=464029 RepID=A0A1Q9AQN3_9HYPH|nr:prepilin-type N-terminal cleavage/methylation domain-containing protein [Xaviernesmea oryzae]OLP57743.1 hypothetical protein BJF93_12810 [Xaviernesmea oryzae]